MAQDNELFGPRFLELLKQYQQDPERFKRDNPEAFGGDTSGVQQPGLADPNLAAPQATAPPPPEPHVPGQVPSYQDLFADPGSSYTPPGGPATPPSPISPFYDPTMPQEQASNGQYDVGMPTTAHTAAAGGNQSWLGDLFGGGGGDGGLLGKGTGGKDWGSMLMALGGGIAGGAAYGAGGWGGGLGRGFQGAAAANQNSKELNQRRMLAEQELKLRTQSDAAAQADRDRSFKLQEQRTQSYAELVKQKADAAKAKEDTTASVVSDIADGIETGKQPPSLTGMYGKSAAIRAELQKRGFDLAKSDLQWKAAQKQIASLNGPQMVRYTGLATSVINTIDEVNNLATKWDNGSFGPLNKAKAEYYVQARGNTPEGQLAAQYLAAANTLKEEFANLAQGGYAPTEAAWGLANKQINENYGADQLKASLTEVQRLLNYRMQAIPNFQTLGPGAANQYTGNSGAEAQPHVVPGDAGAAPAAAAPMSFGTEAEAIAAETAGKLKKGDKIILNGISGTWQ